MKKGLRKRAGAGCGSDIDLRNWRDYDEIFTDSLWVLPRRDNSGAHSGDYHGNFVPQIPRQMICRYTKKGEWVVDAFAGSGTTLIESRRLGRHALGVELQKHIAKRAQKAADAEPNELHTIAEVVAGDCTSADFHQLLQKHGQESAQLLIMHPPYHDIIQFSDDKRDMSNARSVDDFLRQMRRAIENASAVLDNGRHFILVIGDKYAKGEWVPLGFLLMQQAQEAGFLLKSIVVKNFEETAGKRGSKSLWRYRALAGGFYVFKHEYIFVFQKPAGKRKLAPRASDKPASVKL